MERLAPLAETSRDLIKQTDLLYKLACRLIETCENECNARDSDAWANREITRARKAADEARQLAVEQLKQVRYFWTARPTGSPSASPKPNSAMWKGWSSWWTAPKSKPTTGASPPAATSASPPRKRTKTSTSRKPCANIHVELEDLNAEAVQLAATIKKNFEELGV